MSKVRLGVDQVRGIAELARLSFNEEELAAFTAQLAAIVEYVGVIEGADVPPLASGVEGGGTRLREDRVTNPAGFEVAEAMLAGAPQRDADLLVVPRVLD